MRAIYLTLCSIVAIVTQPGVLLAAERTVVLKNGNVLQGEVEQRADRILVQTPTSLLRFSPTDVDIVSHDLRSAYREKAASTSGERPEAISELLLWSLRVGLKHEAYVQLAHLRRRWPDYPQLSLLADRVRSHRSDRETTLLPTPSPTPRDTQFAHDHIEKLSKPVVADFVRSIQPLMLNRCGNASCHGRATSTSFSLVGTSYSGVPARLTHRNLGATLRQLGAPASDTVLWMSANSAHGGLPRRPLKEAERLRLFDWIERTCHDLGWNDSSSVRQAKAEAAVRGSSDPFDPEEFNRLARPEPEEEPEPTDALSAE